jgi:hypothetical protein
MLKILIYFWIFMFSLWDQKYIEHIKVNNYVKELSNKVISMWNLRFSDYKDYCLLVCGAI